VQGENAMTHRFAGICAVGLTLTLTNIAAAETVKIGVIGTYSGGYARWGEQFKQAIAVYQKQHGDSVNGNKIEIVYRDDEGPNPARSKQLVEELINQEKVQFIAGFPWSPNATGIAQSVTDAKMPTILFNAAASVITRQSPYFVRVSFTLPQLSAPVGTWAAKNGIKTAMTAVADFPAGIDAEVYFAKAFKAGGGEILDSIRTPLSMTDFKQSFDKVLQRKPDVQFISAPTGPGSIGMVKAWAEALKPAGIKLLATNEITELYLPDYGPAAIGIVSAAHYTENNDSELNKKMRADLTAMFGPAAIPDIATVATYDGMHVMYQIVGKLGPRFNADEAMKLVAGMSFDSPRGGRILIDPKERDIVQDIDIRRVEDRAGKPVNIAFDKVPMVKDLWKDDNPAK
jgi:branched-chain amino acid transport system substrate-binding protein